MIVSADTFNEINSIDNQFFQTYFELSDLDGDKILGPILSEHNDGFSAIITFTNDFACNTVKLIFDEDDFELFGMI